MTPPRAIGAYHDCEEYFEKAANSKNGIAISLESAGQAFKFRQKMNSYRVILRNQSKTIYEPEDSRYNACPYDSFEVKIDPDNDNRVLVRRYRIAVDKVEEL